MMYATHKVGGAFAALLGFEIMRQNGMLDTDIEPWCQLLVMYPACSFGSTLPDLDHIWNNVKEKTPFNWLIHKLIHITNPKHRSWQTHSLLVTGGMLALLYSLVYALDVFRWFDISGFSLLLIKLLSIGLGFGVASHLILDSFTRAGIWLFPGVKIRLVPDSPVFSTDTKYEKVWRVVLYIATTLMLIWVLNPFGLQSIFTGGA